MEPFIFRLGLASLRNVILLIVAKKIYYPYTVCLYIIDIHPVLLASPVHRFNNDIIFAKIIQTLDNLPKML